MFSNKIESTANNEKSKDENETNEVAPERKLIGTDYSYKHEIVWLNVFLMLFIHLVSLKEILLFIATGKFRWKIFVWFAGLTVFCGLGVTVGAHRLFTHRSYKAKPSLRAFLILLQTIAGQNSMFEWCRDHRLHHRYSDTDADPHNIKRGFFFSHVGWLMTKKHPYVIEFGRKIDMTDLKEDWMIRFQKKYYYPLVAFFGIFLPIWIPVYYFGEPLKDCIYASILRYVITLNFTWLVNSAAHLYGTRPYDKNLQPVESWFVSLVALGEGWHNYHHAFPWDYKTSELGMRLNPSAALIRFFETIGLAYDLKTASTQVVKNRIIRTGDGTHHALGTDEARKAVKAFGILHPLNITYTVTYKDPDSNLTIKGLPLFNDKETLNGKIQPEENDPM